MTTCPKCGAKLKVQVKWHDGLSTDYLCGTRVSSIGIQIGSLCADRQLAAAAEILKESLKMMREKIFAYWG